MGTESWPGLKRPGRGVKHRPPSSTEVQRKSRAVLQLSLCAFMEDNRATFVLCLCSSKNVWNETCYVIETSCYIIETSFYIIETSCYVTETSCYVIETSCYVTETSCYASCCVSMSRRKLFFSISMTCISFR